MEASELRIGNWVDSELDGVTDVKLRLLERVLDGIEEIYPIPLTEEWLGNTEEMQADSLSFNHIDYDWWFISELETNGSWYLFIHGKPTVKLPYVHTYQNVIRFLTGKELTINATKEKD